MAVNLKLRLLHTNVSLVSFHSLATRQSACAQSFTTRVVQTADDVYISEGRPWNNTRCGIYYRQDSVEQRATSTTHTTWPPGPLLTRYITAHRELCHWLHTRQVLTHAITWTVQGPCTHHVNPVVLLEHLHHTNRTGPRLHWCTSSLKRGFQPCGPSQTSPVLRQTLILVDLQLGCKGSSPARGIIPLGFNLSWRPDSVSIPLLCRCCTSPLSILHLSFVPLLCRCCTSPLYFSFVDAAPLLRRCCTSSPMWLTGLESPN